MAESIVVSGLVAKRREIAGLVEHHRRQIARLCDDLGHLDATLKLFAPDLDLRTRKPKEHRERNHYVRPGEAPRLILDAMRQAGTPITRREIVEAILAARGLEQETQVIEAMQKSVLAALHGLERKNPVRFAPAAKAGVLHWTLA